jgi:D-arabinose 5-phosphate isomerase GutQ
VALHRGPSKAVCALSSAFVSPPLCCGTVVSTLDSTKKTKLRPQKKNMAKFKLLKAEDYSNAIQSSAPALDAAVESATKLLLACSGTIFLTGVGKSYLVAQKCIATWQSLSVKAHLLHANEMMHGDMGILQRGDMLVYVSNSGNTDELIRIAKYVRSNFSSVVQICMSGNVNCDLQNYTDHAVSISCSENIFDQIGFRLSNSSPANFRLCHPGGNVLNTV